MSDGDRKRPRPATPGKAGAEGNTGRRAAPRKAAPKTGDKPVRAKREPAATRRATREEPVVAPRDPEAERPLSSVPPSVEAVLGSTPRAPRIRDAMPRPEAVDEADDEAVDEADDEAVDSYSGDGGHELGIGSRMVAPEVQYDADSDDSEPRSRHGGDFGSPEEVEAQIRALEARLDGMIRHATGDDEPAPASVREQVESAARDVLERIANAQERGVSRGAADADTQDLLSSGFYHRQWGRLGLRSRAEDVDEFGLDPAFEQRLRPILEFAYRHYFRIETRGVEHIPSEGRCLIVANHSGTLPIDGAMLRTAVRLEHPGARELRWLAEDFVYYLPFVGTWMNRVGAVRACQENAERLLAHDALVAVFPEGVKGIGKLYRDRYRLQRFGRGGFIRLALRTQTPLVPCAVVGAEEMNPMLYRVDYLAKAIGVPYVPVTPTFPWLGPAGLVPAPTKWRIVFGEPLQFEGYGPEAADDHVLVARLSDRVRKAIQTMLDGAIKQRRSVWR